MTTLHVEAAVAGRKRASSPEHELAVDLAEGSVALAALIEAIVRAEVAAFKARSEDERFVRVLTEEDIDAGLAAGAIRSGGRETAADVDADDAVRTALDAQKDGLYRSFVNDEPVDDLQAIVEVRDGTKVMFLRLVALSGG